MIRPTRRAVFLFAAGLPLAMLLIVAAPQWWTVCLQYAGVMIAAMLADAFLAFPLRRLNIEVTAPSRIFIAETGTVTAGLPATRHPWRTHFEMLLEQRGDLEPPETATAVLERGAQAAAALTVKPKRRGRAFLDRLWVRWQGPLGLIEIITSLPLDKAIDVVPNVRGVQKTALDFKTDEAIFGEKIQHKGEGAEFEALREYRPGDDIRFLDWKHSARHRKLLSKEFRTERNHHVVMAFDTGHLMLEPLGGISRLDHAINAALRLTWISLRAGDFVGTYGFDARLRHYAQPVRGIQSFWRVQRSVAGLDYHPQETNFTLGLAELNARLKRRALVLLFTDFVDTVTAELLVESMARIANRHVVVFVTLHDIFLRQTAEAAPARFVDVARSVIAQDFLLDRSIVFERLARAGVHCLDVPSAHLPASLINRYLQIKQRGLI